MSNSAYTYEAGDAEIKSVALPHTLAPRSVPLVTSVKPLINAITWNLVLRWVDIESFTKIQSTCPALKSMCMFYSLGRQVLENRLHQGLNSLARLTLAGRHLNSNEFLPCDSHLATYVLETAQESRNLLQISLVRSSELSLDSFFMLLLEHHVRQIDLASAYFETAVELTEEADLVELRLKRSLAQMQKTFRLTASKRKESTNTDHCRLIADREARQAWRTAMKRSGQIWMKTATFVNRLGWAHEHIPLLTQVLDFPMEGFVTPFKWHTFVALFGPWSLIKRNFTRYVVGGGFCGYIGRNRAERLLEPLPPKIVLMRASRSHSSVIALTYRSSYDSPFLHVTNNSNFWTMPNFGTILKVISNERGAISQSKNVPLEYFANMFERCGYTISAMSMASIDLDYFQDFDAIPITPHSFTAPQKANAAILTKPPIWQSPAIESSFDPAANAYLSTDFSPFPPKRGAEPLMSKESNFLAPKLNPAPSAFSAPPSSVSAVSGIAYYAEDKPSQPAATEPRYLPLAAFLASTSSSSSSASSSSSGSQSQFASTLSASNSSLGSSGNGFSLTETLIPNASQSADPNPLLSLSAAVTCTTAASVNSYAQLTVDEEVQELKKSLLNPNRRSRSVSYRLLLKRPQFLDCSQLEKYMSETEFKSIFHMSKCEFEALPYATRRSLKQQANLQ